METLMWSWSEIIGDTSQQIVIRSIIKTVIIKRSSYPLYFGQPDLLSFFYLPFLMLAGLYNLQPSDILDPSRSPEPQNYEALLTRLYLRVGIPPKAVSNPFGNSNKFQEHIKYNYAADHFYNIPGNHPHCDHFSFRYILIRLT